MAPALFISPPWRYTSPGGTVTFTAAGGSGTGYTWALITNNSGGSIVAGTGVYTAGALKGISDTVQCTDSSGGTATRIVRISGEQTLAQLIANAQSYADMQNSTFVTQTEWIDYLNTGYLELWDLLVEKFGAKYYHQPACQFTTDGQADVFQLPPDFYKGTGADLAVSAPDWWVTLQPFPWAERNRFALRNFQSFYGLSNLRYCYFADGVMFRPNPSAGQTIRLWYVPRATRLVSLTDVLDGVNGWEHYAVLTAAVHALKKEESDSIPLERDLAEVARRITASAENRDQGSPQTVSDSQSANPWSPWCGPTDGLGGVG